jgi:hypothetical protein
MRGNLAEPNLTRRLALLAEARRDDSSVCQHLIEAKAEIERLRGASGHCQGSTRAARRTFYARHC